MGLSRTILTAMSSRVKASAGLGGGAKRPPGDHLSEVLLSSRIFCE